MTKLPTEKGMTGKKQVNNSQVSGHTKSKPTKLLTNQIPLLNLKIFTVDQKTHESQLNLIKTHAQT